MTKKLETRLQQLETAATELTPPTIILRFVSTDGTPDQFAIYTLNGLEDIPSPHLARG